VFAERDQAGLWQGFTSCVDRQTGFVQFWTVVSAHGRIGSGWNQRWIFDFVL
jgi:hypothetical protein